MISSNVTRFERKFDDVEIFEEIDDRTNIKIYIDEALSEYKIFSQELEKSSRIPIESVQKSLDLVSFLNSGTRQKEKVLLITSGSRAKEAENTFKTYKGFLKVFIYCINLTFHKSWAQKLKDIIYLVSDDENEVLPMVIQLALQLYYPCDVMDNQSLGTSFIKHTLKQSLDLKKMLINYHFMTFIKNVITDANLMSFARKDFEEFCKEKRKESNKYIRIPEDPETFLNTFECSPLLIYWSNNFLYKLMNIIFSQYDNFDALYQTRYLLSLVNKGIKENNFVIKNKLVLYAIVKIDNEDLDTLKLIKSTHSVILSPSFFIFSDLQQKENDSDKIFYELKTEKLCTFILQILENDYEKYKPYISHDSNKTADSYKYLFASSLLFKIDSIVQSDETESENIINLSILEPSEIPKIDQKGITEKVENFKKKFLELKSIIEFDIEKIFILFLFELGRYKHLKKFTSLNGINLGEYDNEYFDMIEEKIANFDTDENQPLYIKFSGSNIEELDSSNKQIESSRRKKIQGFSLNKDINKDIFTLKYLKGQYQYFKSDRKNPFIKKLEKIDKDHKFGMGNIYYGMNNFEKAQINFNLQIKKTKEKSMKFKCYYNKGCIYYNIQNYKTAKKTFDSSLKFIDSNQNSFLEIQALLMIALCNKKLGNISEMEDNIKAAKACLEKNKHKIQAKEIKVYEKYHELFMQI